VVCDERGSAVVEFALVVPLLFMLVFGMIDMGRGYYTLNHLASAAREGARLAAVLPDPIARADSVRKIVKSFSLPLGNAKIQDSQIEVTFEPGGTNVTVRIRDYPLTLLTPLTRVVGKSTILITRSATYPWEAS
jgi:Flp pilus assembly protein TadG